jgi:16S rRNA (cytidine1402-2'-O)-methyltransferase
MGTLYSIATPIGNLEDITKRAIRILGEVDVIISEDTRHTGLLLFKLNIQNKKLIPLYDEIEEQQIPQIIDLLTNGTNCAMVSDAGTPLIADPGYKLVNECIKRNIPVSPIPGPSSITAALSASGLPTNSFIFLGFLPKKIGKQQKIFTEIFQLKKSELVKTIVFFESPYRVKKSLELAKSIMGDITIVIARELTKIHEEFFHGTISQAITHFQNPKGEFVILLSL